MTSTVELSQLVATFETLDLDRSDLNNTMGGIIFDAFEIVLDGHEFDTLQPVKKSTIGVHVEEGFIRKFSLPTGKNVLLDTKLAGYDLDVKFTCRDNWMIPTEAVNQWCLLTQGNWDKQVFSYGLLKMIPEHITNGVNKDKKASVNAMGKKNIYWFGKDISFPSRSIETLLEAEQRFVRKLSNIRQQISEYHTIAHRHGTANQAIGPLYGSALSIL